LEGDPVPVAAGHLHDRLDPGALQQRGGGEARRMDAGTRRIGYVDRVGAAAQRLDEAQEPVGIGGERRGRFGGDREMTGGENLLEPAHARCVTAYALRKDWSER
jgi:hypothetical protein